MAYIYKDLQYEEMMIEMDVGEKDPTAYLLRRNFATHLYILHLNEPEIQYVMGHNMEDAYANRHDYSSEEQLVLIARKMNDRPLFNDVFPAQQAQMLSGEKRKVSSCDTSALTLQTEERVEGTLVIHMYTLEPSETINVSVLTSGEELRNAKYCFIPVEKGISRTVNIVRTYQEAYTKMKNKGKK